MANLSVRKIDDTTYQKLKALAEEDGVSMEEEVRRILSRAVATPMRFGDFALECFGSDQGIDLEPLPRVPHKPLDLDK